MEPKDFLRVLLRRRKTVITAILIVVAVAMFGSYRKPPTYAAGCKIQIEAIGPGGPGGTVGDDPKKNSTETVGSFETMIELIHSPSMAAQVAKDIKVPVDRVLGKINATLITGTQVFNFTAVDEGPEAAAHTGRLCNAYAQAFLQYRLDGAKDQVTRTLTAQQARWNQFRRQLEDLDAKIRTATKEQAELYYFQRIHIASNIADVYEEIANLESALGLGLDGAGKVISPAGIGVKIGPDHKKNGILGLIIGLIFGAALALVREYMDDTVKDKEGAQRDLGLSVLATMPFAKDGPGPDQDSIEAARTLRTNLLSQGLGNDLRVMVVTSTLAKRRATTLANLASAVAEAGRSVLVIGSDLRNPRTHEAFGIGNAVGLTNVIRGQVPFEKAIRQVPGMQGVYVMPAGPPVGSPGELLSTDQMSNLVDQARDWADVVLLDAPPVLSAADASVLGTYADGVLLVMSAGQTLRAQATEAKEQLGAAGAKILGAVMFGGQAEPTQTGAGRILALPMLRRGDDEEDMASLSPYGWDGAQAGSFGGSGYGYDGDSYDNYEQSLGNDYSDGFGTGQGSGFGNGYDSGYGNGRGDAFGGYGNGGGNGFGGYGNGNDNGGYGFDEPNWDDQEPVQSPRARSKPKANGNGNGRGSSRANGNGANGRSNGHANGRSNGHANGKANGHANGKSNGKANGHVNGNGRGNGNGHANGRTKALEPNRRAGTTGNGNGRATANGRSNGGYSNGRTNGNGHENGNGRTNGHGNENGHANGRNGGNSNGRSLARNGNGNGNGSARTANGNRNGSARTANGNGNGRTRTANGNGNARTANGNGNGRARTPNGNGRPAAQSKGKAPARPRTPARQQWDDQGGW